MTASIRDVKAKISSLLVRVENGEEVIITSHGKPRAKIIPVSAIGDGTLNLKRIRRIAREAKTGKRFCLNSTKLIRDDRDGR